MISVNGVLAIYVSVYFVYMMRYELETDAESISGRDSEVVKEVTRKIRSRSGSHREIIKLQNHVVEKRDWQHGLENCILGLGA